ncbi:hypothetical protein AYK24_06310 [Thermoplasmatales archaeon SG8-52-4]|nr:MAG: hypothetical protein AYK24_06310 [Thermoplasmatales archaeon SG8-52-4]
MKKILAIAVAFLFFGMIIFPSSGIQLQNKPNIQSYRGNTLYVGGNGTGNYSKIQDAIDNSSENDTVYVYSGIYFENVIVNKTINLLGENRNTTMIDASNFYPSAITIKSNYTNISSFTCIGGKSGTSSSGVSIRADNNSIKECNLINGRGCGIYLDGSHNWINYNLISQNGNYGIYMSNIRENTDNFISNNSILFNYLDGFANWDKYTFNSKIYHNNFIDNNRVNARDYGECTWDNGYPSGGNYWSDYNGIDENGDGIGDTPYYIKNASGIKNEDRYPFMKPLWGNLPPYTYFNWTPVWPYTGDDVFFNASGSYDYDGYITLYEWDWDNDGVFDENHTIPTTIYSWMEEGKHDIMLRVTDNDSLTFQMKRSIYINHINQPPWAPIIDGPKTGKIGVFYNYTFNSIDPEGDEVYYAVIFEEGQSTEWIGPCYSGVIIQLNHSWAQEGTYTIIAIAMDIHQAVSNVSSIQVCITKTKEMNTNLFNLFLHRFPLLQRVLLQLNLK